MPSGNLFLNVNTVPYAKLLTLQGAQWFFPFDDTDIVVGQTGLIDEKIGAFNTSASNVSAGLADNFDDGVVAFAPGVGATCFQQRSGSGIIIKGLSWDSGVGGSMSFWLKTTTTTTGTELYRSV